MEFHQGQQLGQLVRDAIADSEPVRTRGLGPENLVVKWDDMDEYHREICRIVGERVWLEAQWQIAELAAAGATLRGLANFAKAIRKFFHVGRLRRNSRMYPVAPPGPQPATERS